MPARAAPWKLVASYYLDLPFFFYYIRDYTFSRDNCQLIFIFGLQFRGSCPLGQLLIVNFFTKFYCLLLTAAEKSVITTWKFNAKL